MTILPIAVRVYPDLKVAAQPDARQRRRSTRCSSSTARPAPTKRRHSRSAATASSWRALPRRGALCGDDLQPREKAVLERYVASHAADTDPRGIPEHDIPGNPDAACSSRLAEFRDAALPRRPTKAARCSSRSTFRLMRAASRTTTASRRPLSGRLQLHALPLSRRGGRDAPHPVSPASRSSTWIVNARSSGLPAAIDHDKEDRIPEGAARPSRTIVTCSAATCSTPRRWPLR